MHREIALGTLSGAAFLSNVLPSWTDLPQSRQRDLASAVKTTARVCGVPLDGLPLDCSWLGTNFFAAVPASFRMSKRRWANITSELRFVLERIGAHAPRSKKADRLSPAWRSFYEQLPRFRKAGLSTFLRFCTLQDIEPAAVQAETFSIFAQWLRQDRLTKNLRRQERDTRRLWNWARENVPDWPLLAAPLPVDERRYTLPFKDYPPSFQADVEAFLGILAQDEAEMIYADPFAEAGSAPSQGAKPRTIQTRRFQIQQAAAALALTGIPTTEIQSLRDLVLPADRPVRIARFFAEKAKQRPNAIETQNSQIDGITEILRQVAKFHCRLSTPEIAPLMRLRTTRSKKQKQRKRALNMTPKNRARLRPLRSDVVRGCLLHLPEKLWEDAKVADSPIQAAWMMRAACALEILLICPLRLDNLRTLRLDTSFHRLDVRSRSRLTHLLVPEHLVKNSELIEWPLPASSECLIQEYIRHYRPILAKHGNPYLFPGVKEHALSINALRDALQNSIRNHVGITLNPHCLRHFAAWLFLKRHPGQYETVRRILGHRCIETTIKAYTGLEAEFAAEKHDQAVFDERQETRALARAAFYGRGRTDASRRPATR